MNWNELNIQEKADLIKLYVSNGITDLDTIKQHYNSFQEGGSIKTNNAEEPNFITRLKQGYSRKGIIDNQGNPASHKLSVADSRVYPEVQEDEKGNLVDYGAIPYRPFYAYERAIKNKDYVEFPDDESAVNFTEHYKDAAVYPWYGTFDNYYPWRYQDGGDTKKPRGYRVSSAIMNLAHRAVDKNAANTIDTPDNGAPQSTFLMNRKNQQKVFEDEGYIKVDNNDYGPVANAVNTSRHKDVPIYQKYPDVNVDRNNLQKIGTFMDYAINNANTETSVYNGPVESYLTDPANFPVDVYIDRKTGKVYNQGWDYNDYNNIRSTTGISKLKNIAGNILDRIGNPTVVTTGLQENTIKSSEADKYLQSKNPMLSYQKNEDTGEYEIMMKPVTVTAKRTNPVKPKTELRPASELNANEFWDMMEANSRQNDDHLYQDGGPTNNKSDWAKAHEAELALHQLGWDNPDNKLHSDYAAKDDKGYYAGYNLKPVTVRPSVQQQLIDIGKNNPKAKGIVEYVDPDIVAENNTMGLKLWGALAGVKAPINYKKTLDYLSTPFSSTIKALAVNKNNFLKRAGWIADTSLNVLGSGDALLNVLNENGVTNTINAFSKGDYKEGVLSGIGDLWNISSIYGLKKYIPNKLPNVNIFRNRKLNKEWIRNKGYEPLVNDIRTAFIHQNEDFPELFRPARTALIKTNHNQGLNGVKMQFDDHNYILNGSKWYTPWKWDLRNVFYGSAENIPSYTLEPDVIRYHPLTFFTSPKSFQGITAHEINHSFARLYSKKGSLSEFSNAKKGYPFIANDDNVVDLSAFNKRAFKHNGSPEELQSDMRKWKHELSNDQRIPYNYMPANQQEKYIDLAEEQYFINKDVLKKLLTDLSSYGYFQNGGFLGHITPYGQWQYPHQITTIPSNNITMKGVNYPVIGVSNTGDTKMMFPNLDYTFNGNYVTEYPVNQ